MPTPVQARRVLADRITLQLDPRTTIGKHVKKLRRQGTVPVHLYGPGITPRFLQCQGPVLIKALTQAGGNTPIFISLPDQGEEHLAFVREVQWDPIRGNLFHVDFLRTDVSKKVSAEVPIILEGESPAAKEAGGIVNQLLRSVMVEALPLEMPSDIRIDVSVLVEVTSVLRVGDAPLPGNATLLTDSEELVARVELPRAAPEDEFAAERPAAGEETGEEEA